MKKRIQIDGKWYVEESTLPEQDFDVTFSYEACSGMFDFSVCLKEVDDNQRLEIYKGTESISAYLEGRDQESEIWDNSMWLRDFRDGVCMEGEERLDLTDLQTAELQDLLIAVTEKGWL